ncbi:DMT family transporter [Microbacterium sp. NC79]|uniref:DMT family transporter n=1 Tax=Microbacterium sp. NC79 TaxID=2851009 RepID=UPI00349FC521
MSRRTFWMGILAAIMVGALTAIQARINGNLGTRLENGFVAGFISFASGLAALIVITVLTKSGRAGAQRLVTGVRDRRIPWYLLTGGLAGAFSVATQGLTVGIIGVALFTVGIVAGQAVTGLIIDRIGYGPAGAVAVTVGRAAGAALALASVVVALTGDLLERTPWWILFMPFGVGVGIAYQQATNGRLGLLVGNPMTATLMNFIAGTTVLTIAAVISVTLMGPTNPWPTEPWLYVGGVIGVLYIFVSAAVVHRIGVLLLGLASVVGQLTTSVIVDAFFPASNPPAWWQSTIMVVLALAAVITATVPWNRLKRRRRR